MDAGDFDTVGRSCCGDILYTYQDFKARGLSTPTAVVLTGVTTVATVAAVVGNIALSTVAGTAVHDKLQSSCTHNYLSHHNITNVDVMSHCDKSGYTWAGAGVFFVCLAAGIGITAVIAATAGQAVEYCLPKQYQTIENRPEL